ncbi:MAG TPA: ABC transporter permease [Solirubrobacteraceae bacterium]|nr:ABC transporter permease [Solirubrobacteraceae bacterium]
MRHLILVDLRRHGTRTVLTGLGIAIGVATIVALLALSAGIDRSAAGLINLGGAELGIFQGGVGELTASSLPESLTPRVRRVPGVADADPIAVATGELRREPSFLVFGVRPQGFVVHSLVFVAGRPPRGTGEAVVGDAAARQLGLDVGGTLRLSQGAFRIVGIYHAGVPFEDQGAALPLAVVERIRGRPGDVTTIAVKVARGARASVVGDRLGRVFPGTVAISQPGQVSRVDTNSLLVRKSAGLFVALALIIGGIAVMNTMLMAVFERRSEFALLLAVGWPRRLVAQLVLGEGVVLSLGGALVGVALGIAAGELLVGALGASTLVTPEFSAWTLARAFLVAAAMGTLGSLYPAWWVTRLAPAQALG